MAFLGWSTPCYRQINVGVIGGRGKHQSALICHNLPMCGRYRLSRRKQTIEEHFDTAPWDDSRSLAARSLPTATMVVVSNAPPILQSPRTSPQEGICSS